MFELDRNVDDDLVATAYCDECKKLLDDNDDVYADGDFVLCKHCLRGSVEAQYDNIEFAKMLIEREQAKEKPNASVLKDLNACILEDDYEWIFDEFFEELCEICNYDITKAKYAASARCADLENVVPDYDDYDY